MKVSRLQSIAKAWSATNDGFSLVETVLAAALFVMFVTILTGNLIYSRQSTVFAGDRSRAAFLAEEGLEAVRNIRDADFANLVDGTYGLATSSNEWIFSGSSDSRGVFTREINISTVDADTKEVSADINWQQTAQRNGSLSLVTYLTNWQQTVVVLPTDSCDVYCQGEGRVSGTCRQNTKQCSKNFEVYIPGGDSNCVADPQNDTCCCTPF